MFTYKYLKCPWDNPTASVPLGPEVKFWEVPAASTTWLL